MKIFSISIGKYQGNENQIEMSEDLLELEWLEVNGRTIPSVTA